MSSGPATEEEHLCAFPVDRTVGDWPGDESEVLDPDEKQRQVGAVTLYDDWDNPESGMAE